MTAPEPPAPSPTLAGEGVGASAGRLLVVVNPHASSTSDALRRAVIAALAERHAVDSVQTTHKGHAIELCRTGAREQYDAVVVLGGDGTINEAANGLVGSPTVLAPLPGGATNVYCRMLGVPCDVAAATERLLDGGGLSRPAPLDVGRVNDRWFTFSAGIGLDASVVERVDRHPSLKARWGPWFFAAMGLSVFLRRYVRNPPRLEVRAGDRSARAVSVLLQNGNPYTYFRERPIVLAPDAGLRSGSLGGVALTRASAIDLVPVLWRALSGRRPVTGHPRVEPISDDGAIVVRALDGRPVPVQVDGDHVGDFLEARFEVRPAALRVAF